VYRETVLISYRTFRNGDPPDLARVWNRQPRSDQRLNSMTSLLIDEHVLAKSYFDRDGLLVAVEGARIVGFAHAGFGPTVDGGQLDVSVGATLVLMVDPRPDAAAIATELLARSEGYLRERGAKSLLGGMPSALEPFYLGLTGGCGVPGVLSAEREFIGALEAAGYVRSAGHVIYRRVLTGFRPSFERAQMTWRRSTTATLLIDNSIANWWEANSLASTECLRAELKLRTPTPRVQLRFWDLRPLTDSWGERGQGLLSFACDGEAWGDGLAQFVWSEALTQMQQRGVTCVEAAVEFTDARFAALLTTLGFQEVAQTKVWMKPGE